MNRQPILLPCTRLLLTLGLIVLMITSVARAGHHEEALAPVDASSEAIAMTVLDAFMRTFNQRDPAGHVATYHFPHYRLARGEMAVFATLEEGETAHRSLFEALPKTGWHQSEWLRRTIVGASATKIHVATRFRRLREDGSVIGEYDSLYVLAKVDGRWGVRMRSSFL